MWGTTSYVHKTGFWESHLIDWFSCSALKEELGIIFQPDDKLSKHMNSCEQNSNSDTTMSIHT